MKKLVLAFVSVCSAFALLSASGCNTLCTEIGCTVGVTTALSVDVAALDGAAVRVCREGDCVDGSIAVDSEVTTCEVAESVGFFTSCNVDTEGVVSFIVQPRVEDVEDEEAYSFTITSQADAELASVAGVVTYEKTEINGSGCGYCYEGSL